MAAKLRVYVWVNLSTLLWIKRTSSYAGVIVDLIYILLTNRVKHQTAGNAHILRMCCEKGIRC